MGHNAETIRNKRRNVGAGLLLLGVLMVFAISLAYIVRYDGGVVCRFVEADGSAGEVCSSPRSLAAAKLGAWSSIALVFGLGFWLAVPRAAWRRVVTDGSADQGILSPDMDEARSTTASD